MKRFKAVVLGSGAEGWTGAEKGTAVWLFIYVSTNPDKTKLNLKNNA